MMKKKGYVEQGLHQQPSTVEDAERLADGGKLPSKINQGTLLFPQLLKILHFVVLINAVV